MPPSHPCDEPVPPGVIAAIAEIASALCAGDYDAIVKRTQGRRIPASDIAEAIRQYGRTLVPRDANDLAQRGSIVRVRNANPPQWSVTFPLWTREEGQSDLSVDLSVTKLPTGEIDIELNDIHVL